MSDITLSRQLAGTFLTDENREQIQSYLNSSSIDGTVKQQIKDLVFSGGDKEITISSAALNEIAKLLNIQEKTLTDNLSPEVSRPKLNTPSETAKKASLPAQNLFSLAFDPNQVFDIDSLIAAFQKLLSDLGLGTNELLEAEQANATISRDTLQSNSETLRGLQARSLDTTLKMGELNNAYLKKNEKQIKAAQAYAKMTPGQKFLHALSDLKNWGKFIGMAAAAIVGGIIGVAGSIITPPNPVGIASAIVMTVTSCAMAFVTAFNVLDVVAEAIVPKKKNESKEDHAERVKIAAMSLKIAAGAAMVAISAGCACTGLTNIAASGVMLIVVTAMMATAIVTSVIGGIASMIMDSGAAEAMMNKRLKNKEAELKKQGVSEEEIKKIIDEQRAKDTKIFTGVLMGVSIGASVLSAGLNGVGGMLNPAQTAEKATSIKSVTVGITGKLSNKVGNLTDKVSTKVSSLANSAASTASSAASSVASASGAANAIKNVMTQIAKIAANAQELVDEVEDIAKVVAQIKNLINSIKKLISTIKESGSALTDPETALKVSSSSISVMQSASQIALSAVSMANSVTEFDKQKALAAIKQQLADNTEDQAYIEAIIAIIQKGIDFLKASPDAKEGLEGYKNHLNSMLEDIGSLVKEIRVTQQSKVASMINA